METFRGSGQVSVDKTKKVFFLSILSVALFGNSQAASDSHKTSSIINNTIVGHDFKWISSHPRLFYTPERSQDLKRRIATDPRTKEAWEGLLQRADQLAGQKLISREYAESGTGQHGNYGRPSGQISAMGTTLGLAYHMTGEEKYAEKLREALLHFGKLNRWAGDAKRDPPWHSELNTARFCFGYAVGYDSIYDYLAENDRATIVQAMVERGILPTLNDWILPGKRIHALDSMGHNWWSVCVAMAGVASLSVLGDEPRAEQWVERIKESFPEWFAYQGNILQNKSRNFDAEGAFYESVSYANYALSEYLLFHLAYSNVFGGDSLPEISLLEKAGDFFIHTSYPTSKSLLSINFGDGSTKASGSRTLRLLLANGFDSASYHWYITRTDWGLDDPVGLINYRFQQRDTPPLDLSESVMYPDIGWAMMRSSWKDDATMLAVKSGFTWNHAHPDAGSFILFHRGKPLIIDSGNCSYSRREYTSYYRHSKAHNVILLDGHGQSPEDCGHGDRGVKHPGQVHHLMDLAGIKYVLADATGPTSWKFSRNYRHFLWIDDVILILDDVRTHDVGQLEWLLHFEQEAHEDGADIVLSNGSQAGAIVRPLFPKNMAVVRRKGLGDHDPDTEIEYLALLPEEKSREMKFITAILPVQNPTDEPDVKLELLEGEEMLGVRITRNKELTEVFLNLRADGRRMHRNSNKIIHGWDTDAYLFGVTRTVDSSDDPDSISRCFMVCGSYLRKNGKVMIDSLSKVYSVFAIKGKRMDVTLRGQPIVNCEMRAEAKPIISTLNGKTTTPAWDETRKMVKFHVTFTGR
ncbi:MAG: heparinase II/III family protein [Phycisphaerales bacterium]|nr:MAG: heparinase II/III family protein [Phycisphaerales bacterium]